jgi:hypothetical protein
MIILDDFKHITSTKKDLRNFGLLVGGVFMALGVIILRKWFVPFVAIGVLLVVVGLTQPRLLKWIYLVWMGIATVMGWFMTRIILFLFFVMAVTPLTFVLKITGEKLVDTNINKRAKTYWIPRHESKEYGNLDKQF